MTDAEKFTKLIKLAVKNGLKNDYLESGGNSIYNDWGQLLMVDYNVLFDHDFAKAIWGTEDYVDKDMKFMIANWKAWKWHLQEAVISEDPLQYYYLETL